MPSHRGFSWRRASASSAAFPTLGGAYNKYVHVAIDHYVLPTYVQGVSGERVPTGYGELKTPSDTRSSSPYARGLAVSFLGACFHRPCIMRWLPYPDIHARSNMLLGAFFEKWNLQGCGAIDPSMGPV